MIRLGVNIDHVATLRQARGEAYPDPVQAAVMAEIGGADNITCHLREDRRHIQDRDLYAIKETIKVPLNFEMAATEEMLVIAAKVRPDAVTLVPEKRQERTTEGGLDLDGNQALIRDAITALRKSNITVSLFIEPNLHVVELAKSLGAVAIEFHTGRFCHAMAAAHATSDKAALVNELNLACIHAHKAGLQVHVGHGLNYTNAHYLQHLDFVEEANIGHSIVARALFVGLKDAVSTMKDLLNSPSNKPRL